MSSLKMNVNSSVPTFPVKLKIAHIQMENFKTKTISKWRINITLQDASLIGLNRKQNASKLETTRLFF